MKIILRLLTLFKQLVHFHIIRTVASCLVFSCLGFSPVNAIGISSVFSGISTALGLAKDIKGFYDPTTKELLQQSMEQLVIEISLLQDDNLMGEITGLEKSFNRILIEPTKLDISLFLQQSDIARGQLEKVLLHKCTAVSYTHL
ncbi:MAG TPA: hypothetical protein DCS31_05915, partial [Candidatus Competibacteraceae bacterium]|nr:hypothetical protein [Candidatus Competibacteraceae bacterium]